MANVASRGLASYILALTVVQDRMIEGRFAIHPLAAEDLENTR
jgi:hypothetical protein